MPNFKKSTGYKMKGSSFYGYGNSSPAKVTDSEVREAVQGLNKAQLSYKDKGFVTGVKAFQKTLKEQAGTIAGSAGADNKRKEIKETGGDLNDYKEYLLDNDNIETSVELTNEEKGKAKGKDRKGYIVPKN